MNRVSRAGALIALASFVSFSMAFAADPPPRVPSGQDVGSQSRRFQTESDAVKRRVEKKKGPAPEMQVQEAETKPLAGEGISFVLNDVKVTGAALFSAADLRVVYEPYIGKKVVFEDLWKIAEGIKGKYHEKSYLTTSVYFPEQEIESGVLEIAVLEGKLGEVTVEGNKWFSSSFIRKYIHTKKNELLNIKKLQKDILRLNRFSDLQVKTVISPGKTPETSDIILKVNDSFPWHIGMSEDNRGTRLTERYRTGFYGRCSNLTGLGDSIFANTIFNGSTFGEAISYAVPIGTHGMKLAVDLSYFTMKLGKEYKEYDITGKTMTATPRASFELALAEDYEAYVDLGLDMKSIKKKTGRTHSSNDQLRIPYVSFSFIRRDRLFGGGQTYFSPRFDFSTSGFLGASSRCHPSASRDGTGGYYFKYSQILQRTQLMPFESYLIANTQFQAANHTLPPSEQMQLGGMTSVRGYPEGDYLSDWGGILNLDWVFPCYLFPKDWKLPKATQPLRKMIEPVIFFDMGGGGLYSHNEDERRRKFLAGAGGGVRIRFSDHFFIRLEWAQHFGNQPQGGNGSSTFYMMMQAEA